MPDGQRTIKKTSRRHLRLCSNTFICPPHMFQPQTATPQAVFQPSSPVMTRFGTDRTLQEPAANAPRNPGVTRSRRGTWVDPEARAAASSSHGHPQHVNPQVRWSTSAIVHSVPLHNCAFDEWDKTSSLGRLRSERSMIQCRVPAEG